ncbi:Hypothetical protein FKW44_010593 [Caligus rogercresseyi]|uniref:Uncharacterized protein n=1 Tax=Caligus rogercresseyi TaxID=217165 RepID=A0A7T8HGT5_CALRO|nr:Hypothetical protein FKW44_010593 [Caligus rogercresseyi]
MLSDKKILGGFCCWIGAPSCWSTTFLVWKCCLNPGKIGAQLFNVHGCIQAKPLGKHINGIVSPDDATKPRDKLRAGYLYG